LRGKRAVINQQHSQSGMNALRYAIAPLAHEGRFFGSVQESGAHLASLDFVQRGDADVASIDCVTFGLAQRYAPKWVAGIRVLHTSESTPGLPLISSAAITNNQSKDLFDTLKSLELSAPGMLKFLGLSGFTRTRPGDYKIISDQIECARLLGYPHLC
jgi:ABC-type phosphate/phosphonate transport system substrate-binding protein